MEGELECERCGKSISEGRYCSECKRKLINGFSEGSQAKEDNNANSKQIHIKEIIKKKRGN